MTGKVIPLDHAFPARRPDQVTTFDDLATSTVGQRANPDRLVGQRGLAIYSRMADDEQVKAVLNFKRDAITARGWTFKFRDGTKLSEAEQARRQHVFSEVIARMRGAFSDALNAIMTGRAYGFSVTEKIYGEVRVDGKEWIGINQLLGRDPLSFRFYTDDYGTLTKIEQQTHRAGVIAVEPRRVIHYVHAPEWDHIYGRSDLREAYRSWYIKEQVARLWPLYLERFAGGFLHAELPADNALLPDQLEELDRALKNAKAIGSIRTPAGVKLNAIFPGSTDAFERAVQFHDLAIAKALLVPNLLGISHTGQTGAYSQSQTQLEAFFWTLNADAARLEACLNEQLFRDLGDQNWSDGEYPEFCFRPASMEQAKWILETWRGLLGAGAVVPTEQDEAFLRKLLDMPPRDASSTPLVNPVEEQRRQDALAAGGHGQDDEDGEDEADAAQKKRFAVSRAVSRVNFSVIATREEAIAAQAVPAAAEIVARAVARALGDDAQVGSLIDDDPQDIATFQLNGAYVGQLRSAFHGALDASWQTGTVTAQGEIRRAGGQRVPVTRHHMRSLRDRAAAYLASNSFRMGENVSEAVRAIVQGELLAAVKAGKTVQAARAAIWDRLVAKGMTSREAALGVETDAAVQNALDLLWVDSEEQAAHYLQTLVRTNTFEAMNEARFDEFTDPALAEFVVGLEYSAILDDNTTEICRHLDGRTYAADNERIWDTWRPPNHWGCRSLLIPVTAIDGWDGKEPPDPTIDPQAGFFSRRRGTHT